MKPSRRCLEPFQLGDAELGARAFQVLGHQPGGLPNWSSSGGRSVEGDRAEEVVLRP